MTCKYCHTDIRETCDPSCPFVHDFSGNCFCDVLNVNSAFDNKIFMNRREAEPDEYAEFEGANLTQFLFSEN